MNILLKIVAAGISIGVVLAFAGCEKPGSAERVGRQIDQATQQASDKAKEVGTAVGDQTAKAGEYLDDATITAKIKEGIMSDPMLKVFEIGVTTISANVTLSGSVDVESSIDRAGAIARLVKGVKSVENNLVVKDAGQS
ncbi:MAG: BON domain-containing protein [Gammaproteobacteria bacterium]